MVGSSWGAGCTPLRPRSPLPLRSQILGGLGQARLLSAALVVSVQCPAEPAGPGLLPPASGLWLLLEGVKRPLPPAQEMEGISEVTRSALLTPHFVTLLKLLPTQQHPSSSAHLNL